MTFDHLGQGLTTLSSQVALGKDKYLVRNNACVISAPQLERNINVYGYGYVYGIPSAHFAASKLSQNLQAVLCLSSQRCAI